jgi:hypothetical protein
VSHVSLELRFECKLVAEAKPTVPIIAVLVLRTQSSTIAIEALGACFVQV